MWVLIILKNYEVGNDEIRKTINLSSNMYGETSVFVISVKVCFVVQGMYNMGFSLIR